MTQPGSALPPPNYPAILSAAAHDLRSPLSTIYGFARTIERVAPLADPAAGFLQHVLDAARDMDRLLDHLSLLARIGDGRFAPEGGPLSTAQLAAAVATAGAALAGDDDGPVTVLTAETEAIDALVMLAQAAARLDADRTPLQVRAVGEAVEFAPLGDSATSLLGPEADGRDLVLATALHVLRALGATITVEPGLARVTFPPE